MTTADLKAILRQYLSDALDADLQHHRNTKPGLSVYSGRVPFGIDPVEQDIETIDHLISEYRDWLIRREVSRAEPTLSRLMAENNVPAEDRVELGLGLLQVNVQVLEKARERVVGGAVDPFSAAPADERSNHRNDSVTVAPTGPLLSEVLPAYLDYMVKEEGWRGQTLAQNSATYRMLQEHCGDKPVQSYTRKDMTAFYDILRALPALWSKRSDWTGLSLKEIAERSKNEVVPRMTMKTVSVCRPE
ncbi:hypothetical protein [Ferrovibrio sp.]|uniref:hypothetical protein n=1 Tax=Ferrovibrio sp. TaxID=1917215 RepID=UPI0025BE8FE0|nr:hypothetical protein [Ferrovibrio sp.]